MKRPIPISSVLLLSSISLAAQNAVPPQSYGTAGMEGLGVTDTVTVHLPAFYTGCPVSLHAQQSAAGQMVQVGGQHPKGIGQGLHLVLTSPNQPQMVAARVTVRGLTPRNRVTRTLSSLSDDTDADAARTVAIALNPEPNKAATGDLWVPGLTAIHSVELVSVTFADGATFKLPSGANCRTRPDPLMLISGR
jgi:hypothetical protein